MSDNVNNPSHYTQYKNGQVIDITSRMDFCLGNAVKYLMRAGHKGGPEKFKEDLQKAEWYISYYLTHQRAQINRRPVHMFTPKHLELVSEIKHEQIRYIVICICIYWFITMDHDSKYLYNAKNILENMIKGLE